MAESPPQAATPTPTTPTALDTDATQYWCYHCEKRVSVETLTNLHDVSCRECKTGFVEPILAALLPPFSPRSISPDHVDGSQFLQFLRLIAQAAHDEDTPPQRIQNPELEDDILRVELDEWENDEDANENEENEENRIEEEEDENEEEEENEGGEDRSDNENEENREIDEEDRRRRRSDVLRLQIRNFASRARTGRNRIVDWTGFLMGLEAIEFRLEVTESDRYVGNPEDYVDAAGYETLLQNLADSDGGRRGAPPASKSSILELPTVEVLSEQETIVCAICKDMVGVGEKSTKLPCEHSYHGDCIMLWLGSRNSCPVCRFELPTDDPDYEEERKKRVTASLGGASTSSGENSSLG